MGETAHSPALGVGPADYDRLFEAHYPQVLAYCIRRVGRQDGGDLAAEVFAVAWRRLNDVPGDEGALPWLYGVAYRVVSHHWRGTGRRARLMEKLRGLPAATTSGPEAIVVQRLEYQVVLQAAAKLRPKDQEVLRLGLWEELDHSQIAEVMGTSTAAARQRFHRAKKALTTEYERQRRENPPPATAQQGGGR